jgi:hypothetical protein
MKVQVVVTSSNKFAGTSSERLELTVMPMDTVNELQERIVTMTNTFPFSDKRMLFNGKVLDGTKSVSVCGIVEGDVLEFVFEASEHLFVQQLSDLIGKQTMSVEELRLLYIHRQGISVDDVLKFMGHTNQKFFAFLEDQKCFCLNGDFVSVLQGNDKTQALDNSCSNQGHYEVKVTVEIHVPGRPSHVISDDELDEAPMVLQRSDTVARVKEILAAAKLVPFPDRELLLAGTKLQDNLSMSDAGVTDGALLVLSVCASESALVSQLVELLGERTPLSPTDLSLHYCQRFGTPVCQSLRMLGLRGNFRRFIEGHPRFSLNDGCVTLVDDAQARHVLDSVIDLLSESCFLNIDSIDKSGHGPHGESIAKVFVKGLPAATNDPMIGALQKAVASSLQTVNGGSNVECASVDGGLIQVRMDGKAACLSLAAAPA